VLAALAVVSQDRLPSTAPGGGAIAEDRLIGAALCHPLHAVFLAPAYGLPLAYYGDIGGRFWPAPNDLRYDALQRRAQPTAAERLVDFRRAGSRYVVATDLGMLVAEPDLAWALRPFPSVLSGDTYRVWDLTPGEPSACAGGPS